MSKIKSAFLSNNCLQCLSGNNTYFIFSFVCVIAILKKKKENLQYEWNNSQMDSNYASLNSKVQWVKIYPETIQISQKKNQPIFFFDWNYN